MKSNGEWFRKHHRGALGHRRHSWTGPRDNSQMETDCGRVVKDDKPLIAMDVPTWRVGHPRPTGYCRVCSLWRSA